MELTIASTELARELSLALGVTDAKASIPFLDCTLVKAEAGAVSFTSTNLQLAFQSSCPAEVAAPGSVAVPTKPLLDYIRQVPDIEVTLKSTEQDSLEVTWGAARTRFSGHSADKFPAVPEQPDPLTAIPVRTLETALKRTRNSVAADRSHFTLSGALLEVEHNSVALIATDGHRLALYREFRSMAGVTEPVQCVFDPRGMAELVKILGHAQDGDDGSDRVDFAEDGTNMYFLADRRLLVSPKLSGKFPDYKRVLPEDFEISLKVSNAPLLACLRRVRKFADSKTVRFDLEPGRLKMGAQVDSDSIEESLDIDYDGDGLAIGFDGGFIIDFLSVCDSPTVLLELRDQVKAAQMRVTELGADVEYRYVMMPQRV